MSKKYDLAGLTFGKLTVIDKLGSAPRSGGRTEIKWKCVCDCGNEVIASTANLNNGKCIQCYQCAHDLTGLKRRQDLTGETYGKLTVKKMLYNYNNTNKTKCLCDCECGKTDVIKDPYSIKTGKISSCGCIKGISQRKLMTGKTFGRLTVVEEIFTDPQHHKVRCVCSCGTEIVVARGDVMSGHTNSCGCLQADAIRLFKDVDYTGYISDYGIEIIDKYGKNNKGQTLWNCKCGICGNIFQEIPARIKCNHIRSCGCIVRSSREIFIDNYLNDNNIQHICQYKFDDCKSKNGYRLRFDFGVFDININLLFLIEYDGKQHFEPVDLFGGEDAYIDTVERDIIKNKYCKEHNIILLRIQYTYTEQEIIDAINNTLESVTTTGVA